MSSKNTENLGLHSWERTDPFMMEEFNENFDKLDQAVGENMDALKSKADKTELTALNNSLDTVSKLANGAARIHIGSYQGTGKGGVENPNKITFPFTPKIVFITYRDYTDFYTSYSSIAVLFWGETKTISYSPSSVKSSVSYDGNTVRWYSPYTDGSTQLNGGGVWFGYLAIG